MAVMRSWVLLLFFALLPALATSSAHGNGNLTLQCHPDQAATLLQLKKSFFFDPLLFDEGDLSTTKLQSWQDGTDCCRWEGVGCGGSSGRVTTLDLNGRGLYSFGLDPVIFNLTYLQFVDLSMNNFYEYSIPAVGFERLTSLTHLNLSNSGFLGQIPIAIGKLGNLVSLDLSNYAIGDDDESYRSFGSINSLSLSNFQTLVRNLSNLRELYLDYVEMDSTGEEWCRALAKFVPHLQVLSLQSCYLYGSIHESLSNLSSLSVINLQSNEDILPGPFPQFFMGFVNLSVLLLADTNLEGMFPRRNFQSENLMVLDLSWNMNLSGSLPNFSKASSLVTLRLDGTNFSYAELGYFANFKSLKEINLDGKFISMDFVSSFSMLGSLGQLQLSRVPFSEKFGAILSLIGELRNLTSLELVECDFSSMKPYSISNLSLKRLIIVDCNLTMLVLSEVGNIIGLESLHISGCRVHGSMPSSIGNLTNLKRLYINDCGFLGLMPPSIGNLINLSNLNIYSTNFSGPIPSTVGFLRNLESLVIYECKFTGPMPSTIGNLTNLRSMDIHNCEIPGPIPSALGFLRNLKVLSFSGCMFSGPIPYTVGQLKELKIVRLIGNNFSGKIPNSVGNLTRLLILDLQRNFLTGKIPNSVGNLTRLLILDLQRNFLTGKIPTSVFTLPILECLVLSENELSSHIEEFDVASSCLVDLDLAMNELTGEVPRSFLKMRSLELLDIGSNNFVGSVDIFSFWRFHELTLLSLSNNKLSVTDGAENNSSSMHPSRLVSLEHACCRLTKFPSILTRTSDVSYLDLSCNRISGDIPSWIWERWSSSLTNLNLSHNMFTGMRLNSPVLPLSTTMEMLDLSSNRLQGQVPMPNSSALILDYSNNSFSSIHPNFTMYLSDTEYLKMAHNNISGHIPNSICNSMLGVLDLSYNNFNGLIPSCLIESARLTVLNLRENHFQGTFPSNITDTCALQTIDFHGNMIEGQLPRALYKCTDLEVLDFGNNQVVDTFPSWLGRLPNLHVLILRSNHLYGSIGDQLAGDHQSREYFSSLQIIDLASNNFSGNLSSEWFRRLTSMMAKFNSTGHRVRVQTGYAPGGFYQNSVVITYKGLYVTFESILTTLTAIDFSNNSLDGTIPASVGRLVSLRALNFSHNAFTGKIPSQLGGMTDLESLDLSCNQLSGGIPQELTDLTFLGTMNLSDNQLVGKIPQARQFSTFGNSSFEGNFGLCGPQLSKPCGASPDSPSPGHVDDSSHVDVVLFLFVGLGFGVGFTAAILVRWGWIGKWFVKSVRALWT